MSSPRILLIAALALAGCSVPGLPQLGGPPALAVLSVTSVDPGTGVTTSKCELTWPNQLNAKTYEILRQIGTGAQSVLKDLDSSQTSYEDPALAPGTQYTYTLRVLNGTGQQLTVSQPTATTVLAQQVGKPTGLMPAANATVALGTNPTFSWQAVSGATWYDVVVTNESNNQIAFSAITKDTQIQFGANSPLAFDNFKTLFPVGTPGAITKGVVFQWTVSAIRADVTDTPDNAKAIDMNPSAAQTFSQGG